MAAQSETLKPPPYVSFTTFINSLNKLREIGVPNRIDASVFPGQSGSGIAALIGAMKYLGLIDEVGNPQKIFSQIVDSNDEDRGELIKPILLDRYKFITNDGFDLNTATSQQVERAFRDQGISGSTVTKSVSFFLAAAALAGLKTSPHVKAQKAPRGVAVARQKRRTNTDKQRGDEAPDNHAKPHHKSSAELLLGKFPDFDPNWPDGLKAAWFESFAKLQGMMKEDTK